MSGPFTGLVSGNVDDMSGSSFTTMPGAEAAPKIDPNQEQLDKKFRVPKV